MAPKIVVLTGAGISAESNISTFRAADGLWENHRVEDVASPEGFATDPDLVHRFYDARRRHLFEVEPNAAHEALARLERESTAPVTIITQNVDDLHERAGSTNVIHMHGELRSALCAGCGERAPHLGDLAHRPACSSCGEAALRPDIVWFGEAIYGGERIWEAVASCDVFAVIGTSSTVYPAAGLAAEARGNGAETVLLNLDLHEDAHLYDVVAQGPATQTVPAWVDDVLGLSRNP